MEICAAHIEGRSMIKYSVSYLKREFTLYCVLYCTMELTLSTVYVSLFLFKLNNALCKWRQSPLFGLIFPGCNTLFVCIREVSGKM